MPSIWNVCGITFYYFLFFLITFSFISSIINPYTSFLLKIFTTPLFIITSLLSLASHFHSMLTDNSISTNTFISDQTNRKCTICCITKPKRAHHCSICNKCIMKMDHHCIWIGNCVGLKNIKSFYLCLMYSFISCLLCVCVTFVDFLNYFNNNYEYRNWIVEYKVDSFWKVVMFILGNVRMILFYLSVSCFLIGGFLMFWIGVLMKMGYENMKHGITNIERISSMNNIKECEYYKEDVFKERIIEIFGESWLKGLNPFVKGSEEERLEFINDNHYIQIEDENNQ